ncbi:arf/Sar family protein [Cryptococcus gattii Ru294]|nr:arf/Sar family protein [Cryptococcus gattii Ru294]
MYHLIKGLHDYLTRKDEYSVVIIGLDNAGKTTLLEKIKTMYNPTPGMAPDKIGPTIGQNIGKISLPSTTLHFYDLGGQRDIRSIWEKYYDECHAVVFVLDATDQARLSETWEVFDEVLNSPRLLNLPLLLLANKQDSPSSLSVAEIRESFDVWQRARTNRNQDSNEDDLQEPGEGKAPLKNADGAHGTDAPRTKGEGWDDGGAKAERMASLDVMGISALEGTGVRDAINWLYIRVQNARKM